MADDKDTEQDKDIAPPEVSLDAESKVVVADVDEDAVPIPVGQGVSGEFHLPYVVNQDANDVDEDVEDDEE